MAPTAAALMPSVLCCLLLVVQATGCVEEACKRIAVAKDSGVSHDFCVRVLQSDTAGATTDRRGLAAIAGKVGSRKAKSVLAKINKLREEARGRAKMPLRDCRELYHEAVDNLSAAAAAAKACRYADANIKFSAGIDAARTCEDGFSEKKIKSPLAAENRALSQISAIGTALTSEMINPLAC
ncbi:putative invertase inhibitor [Wolffia australiana]